MPRLPWLLAPLLLAWTGCRTDDVVARARAGDGGLVDRPDSASEDGATGDGAGGCLSSECPAGQLCDFDRVACAAVAPSQCGLPAPEDGTAALLRPCSPPASYSDGYYVAPKCAAGAVCVPQWWRVDQDAGVGEGYQGVCLPGCDPCAPACPAGFGCVARGPQGGFCSLYRVGGRGAWCDPTAPCGGRLQCSTSGSALGGDVSGVCVVPCVPDDPAGWANSSFDVAHASDDCPPDTICVMTQDSVYGPTFVCQTGGAVATVGARCGGAQRCLAPLACLGGVCSPDCAVSPCPAGIDCFLVTPPLGQPEHACVPDGALLWGSPCAEDRNCVPPLRCLPTPNRPDVLTCDAT